VFGYHFSATYEVYCLPTKALQALYFVLDKISRRMEATISQQRTVHGLKPQRLYGATKCYDRGRRTCVKYSI
jgi:hypothetical protein